MTKRVCVLAGVLMTGVLAVAGAQVSAAQRPAAPGPQGRPGGAGGRGGFTFPPVGAIRKAADNLYWIPGAGGNTAAFVTANGVVLVDTKLANNGQAIMDQVKSVTGKPVTHIINTHTHGDHTGSNQFFPAAVEIVTQANTAANMKTMEVFQAPANANALPDRTFTSRLTLLSGRDAIDLYYFGAAHTSGDALVVFRNARVMHAGDMFAGKSQPLIDVNNGGSGVAYGETIRKAASEVRNVDRVITGHDTEMLLTWQDFVDYGEFNRLFLAHARQSLAMGKTAEQAMMTFTLPEKFKGYTIGGGRGGAAGNFGVLYTELRK